MSGPQSRSMSRHLDGRVHDMPEHTEENPAQNHFPFRAIATDAIRFWERGRILYNGTLAAITIVCFAYELPGSFQGITFGSLFALFILALIANMLYCLAYPIDVFWQISGFQKPWVRWRWLLLALGTFTGAVLALYIVAAMLESLAA